MGVRMLSFAHKSEDGRLQTIEEHLINTAALSKKFADYFNAGALGHLIGIAHDLGKYSKEFENRILNNGPSVDHSTAGAKEVKKIAGLIPAYCIAGHHGGLPDGGSIVDRADAHTLYGRLKKQVPNYSAFQEYIKLDQQVTQKITPPSAIGMGGFTASFFIHMLFSCLVDSDFLDTENFMKNGTVIRGNYDVINSLYNKLLQYISKFKNPKNPLNKKRNEILNQCLKMGKNPKGLFTLTVPTGGGKTISSMAFALSHSIQHSLNRVIYVIPYTSIIEQNAEVFRKILGDNNVLEHHCNVYYDDEDSEKSFHRLASENWDAPIIVTTNVQFFESLFSNKPSRCRKLHNICNSVIIFDEAQMIPIPYLYPCVRAISELVYNYNCTAVLCSATQPALEKLFPSEIKSTEICENTQELFDFFHRCNIQNIGQLSDEELIKRITEQKQVLCIVNTRKHAQNIFDSLNEEGCYHLSTLMYPQHRKWILNEIRDRLSKGLPCRVISTSLIEAGVDVDFPIVYREEAGLDSQIQAAGRCNRENRYKAEESITYIFKSEEKYQSHQPLSLRQPTEVARIIANRYNDVSNPDAIRDYFQTLYNVKGENLDSKNIVNRLEDGVKNGFSFPFATISEEFSLIQSDTHTVLIPKEPAAQEIAEQLKKGSRSNKLLRQSALFSVNIYEEHWRALYNIGAIEMIDDDISLLTDLNYYSEEKGLICSVEEGLGIMI